jgi:hypothetical protein
MFKNSSAVLTTEAGDDQAYADYAEISSNLHMMQTLRHRDPDFGRAWMDDRLPCRLGSPVPRTARIFLRRSGIPAVPCNACPAGEQPGPAVARQSQGNSARAARRVKVPHRSWHILGSFAG